MTQAEQVINAIKSTNGIRITELYDMLPHIHKDTIRARVSEMNKYQVIQKVAGRIFWIR